MDLNGMGLLGAVIVGALAGWIAEKVMKSDMGLLMNMVLGIVGAAVLNFLLSLVGIYTGTGIIVYLIVGVVGACLLIAVGRAIRR